MLGIKIIIFAFIFLSSSAIGVLISKKYEERVNELKDFKISLNLFKTKIQFTYEPIPEIFKQISNSINSNVGNIFKLASIKMKFEKAGDAWEEALEGNDLNINEEDKSILKNLSKLLGQTDIQGQLNQIEITSTFLDEQIKKAEEEKIKNEKMYRSLGMVVGLAIVIILI